MVSEPKEEEIKKYFLTWTHPACHDGDEWVAIAYSLEDLKNKYAKALKSDDDDDKSLQGSGLRLKAYEYCEDAGFTEINIG